MLVLYVWKARLCFGTVDNCFFMGRVEWLVKLLDRLVSLDKIALLCFCGIMNES
jgi:hypothetical protein